MEPLEKHSLPSMRAPEGRDEAPVPAKAPLGAGGMRI